VQYKYNITSMELHEKFHEQYEIWLNKDSSINRDNIYERVKERKSNRQLNWKYEDWLAHQLDFALHQLEEEELPRRGYY